MYVPTDELGSEAVEGDLIWRMQFRKGFHPESMRGVTTLIEIEFNADQIQDGSSEPADVLESDEQAA